MQEVAGSIPARITIFGPLVLAVTRRLCTAKFGVRLPGGPPSLAVKCSRECILQDVIHERVEMKYAATGAYASLPIISYYEGERYAHCEFFTSLVAYASGQASSS